MLAEVIDTIDEPYLILDCSGGIQHKNHACQELFGRLALFGDLLCEASRIARTFDSGDRIRPAHPASADCRVAEIRAAEQTFRLRASFLKPTSANRVALVLVGVEQLPIGARTSQTRNVQTVMKAQYLLTPREIQVVDLLGMGHTNRSIADRLGVSVHTARHHTGRVLAKLGAKCRSEVGAMTRTLRA